MGAVLAAASPSAVAAAVAALVTVLVVVVVALIVQARGKPRGGEGEDGVETLVLQLERRMDTMRNELSEALESTREEARRSRVLGSWPAPSISTRCFAEHWTLPVRCLVPTPRS